MEYRFKLLDYRDRSKPKYQVCPDCGFKRYIPYTDMTTGQYLTDGSGKCERVEQCGRHVKPESVQKVQKNRGSNKLSGKAPLAMHVPTFMEMEKHVIPTLTNYGQNHLVRHLVAVLGPDAVAAAFDLYFVGTWREATVFWYVDAQARVVGGKVMQYDANGHRNGHVTWMHAEGILNLQGFVMEKRLFGEHLLSRFPGHIVAIVESEKTALIASILLPQYVWLATGGKAHLTVERCAGLKGRHVVLFPDLAPSSKPTSTSVKWEVRLTELNDKIKKAKFELDDTLERFATEADRACGLDIADYLLRLPKPAPVPLAIPVESNIVEAPIPEANPVESCTYEAPHVPPDVAAYLTLSELHRRAPQAAWRLEKAHGPSGWWLMRVPERKAAWAVATSGHSDPPSVILERMRLKNPMLDLLINSFQIEVC